jgi:transposase
MKGTRFIGIDLSKRSMEVAFISERKGTKLIQKSYATTPEGKQQLANKLTSQDKIALETGNHAFVLATFLSVQVGCTVYVLNAGKLHIIFESHRKTDKEDAVRLAKFIQRTPEEELPLVNLPNEKELTLRKMMAEYTRLMKNQQIYLNQLHSLFWDAGITGLKKSDLRKRELLNDYIKDLPTSLQAGAYRLCRQLDLTNELLEEVEAEQTAALKDHLPSVTISMSVPGVGPKVALAVESYIGDITRFSNQRQICYFAGLTPKLDQSGQRMITKGISKCGPSHLRKYLTQAAWAAIRSKGGEVFKAYFEHLKATKGKKKAIVAVARKLLVILYTLHKNQTLFQSNSILDHDYVIQKLANYGLLEKEKGKLKKNR